MDSILTQDDLTEAKITIDQAKESRSDHLYAMNTSDLDGRRQRGEINCKITVGEQGEKIIKIADTWIPIDLSHYLPKKTWLGNYEFIRLVKLGIITLIDDDVAQSISNQTSALVELERVRNYENRLSGDLHDVEAKNEQMLNQEANRQKIKDFQNNLKPVAPEPSRNSQSGYSNLRVITILNNQSYDEATKLNSLTTMRNELNRVDLDYIMDKAGKDESKLKSWAIELRKRKN